MLGVLRKTCNLNVIAVNSTVLYFLPKLSKCHNMSLTINIKRNLSHPRFNKIQELYWALRGNLIIYNSTHVQLRGAPAADSPPRSSKQPRPARRRRAPRPPGQRRRRRQLVGRPARAGAGRRGTQVEHDRLPPEALRPGRAGRGGGGLASPRDLAAAAHDGVDGLAHHD